MDTINLKEASAGGQALTGAKWRAKLIAADAWGSSAFYTSEALKRDGARVFHKGLQMFQNHMTDDEKWQRPENSVQNLVGTLDSDAEFEEAGPEGPGLYADVSFYPSYISRIGEIHKDVGLSVNAQGLTESGERDGRFGPILVALLDANSVDVVTRAGAGGKLTSILESDRGLAGTPIEPKENQSMTDVTKEDFDGLAAKFDALPGLFVEALKSAGLVGSTEAKTSAPVEGTATATVTDTSTSTISDQAHEVEIDHAAIVEALRVEELPAAVVPAVIADIKAGKSVADAVKAQTALREAFVKTASAGEQGVVHLQESASGEAHGFARAVERLGKPIAITKGMS